MFCLIFCTLKITASLQGLAPGYHATFSILLFFEKVGFFFKQMYKLGFFLNKINNLITILYL